MLHYQKYDVDMNHEVFKTIKKYPRYAVSNYGRVINQQTGHMMAPHKNSSGYYNVQFTIHRKNHHPQIHRLVAYTFMDNPDPKHMNIVNHLDENPYNNRLDNLEFCDREWNANWGTAKERIQRTRKVKKQLVGVYAIHKHTQKVFKFNTLKDASIFSGVNPTTISQALKDWHKKIEGEYVFCLPQQYSDKYAEKLINNSLEYHYQNYNGIYVINTKTKKVVLFDSLKQLGKELHISARKVDQLIKNPRDKNPYPYVFCTKDQYDPAYISFLIKVKNEYAGQATPIVGMNINTEEIRHFSSIKQAEHVLNNQSVQPYLSGKVKSAKDWVFCKEFGYTKKLLQQKAREANPNQNFEIVILNCKTGETINTLASIKDLAIKYQVSNATIRNQLNHNAVSMNGQQFIYQDNYDSETKQFFMNLYAKRTRGKAVYTINIDTLEINKYDSVTQASKELNISQDRILAVLKRDSNQTEHYAFSYETYYSKFRMYLLAYIGKYGKDGFPVNSVDKNGKQKFYPSVKEASKVTGIRKNNIFRVIRGEHKTAGGYSWFKENRDKYIQSLIK